MLVGSTPRYLAKLNDGRVVLTTSSTGPRVVNRGGQQMQTSVFKVDCKSKITVVQNNQPFSIDKSGRTVRTTAGTTAKGMIAHPLKISSKNRARRSIYNEGLVPRCVKTPEQLVCRDKKDASPPSANGCGSKGTEWVPDFTFGAACDKHDLCYASCSNGQFNKCNEEFFDNMVQDGCSSKKHWYMWLVSAPVYGTRVRRY